MFIKKIPPPTDHGAAHASFCSARSATLKAWRDWLATQPDHEATDLELTATVSAFEQLAGLHGS
jgi:hypothetical protein